jgi:hypothetical protein
LDKKHLFIAFFIALLSILSCKKDKLDKLKEDWNPTFALPLINSSLGISHILKEDGPLSINPQTNVITFVYKGELLSFSPEQFLSLPNQSNSHRVSFSAPEIDGINLSGSMRKMDKMEYGFNTEGDVRLDSITLKSGSFNFSLSNRLPCSGKILVLFPFIKKGNQPLKLEIVLDESGRAIFRDIDLSSYSISLSHGQQKGQQEISMEYILDLQLSSKERLSLSHSLDFSFNLSNLKFSGVFGYFGQPRVALDTDAFLLDVFKNFTGYFALTNPRFKVEIDNSFGFPIQLKFNELKRKSAITGIETPIMLTGFPGTFNMASPNITELGKSKSSGFEINRSNSALDSLLTPTPQYFVYGIEAAANVNNPPSAPLNSNFMTDKSRFTVNTELEIPLEGFAYGFSLTDTIAFNLNQQKPQEIDSLIFRIAIENGFPIDLRMQMVFLNEKKQPLDSLLPYSMNYILKSGVSDANGRVNVPNKNRIDISIGNARAAKIAEAKYIILKGSTNTWEASAANPSNQVVKFYSDYKLHIKAGAKVFTRAGKVIK